MVSSNSVAAGRQVTVLCSGVVSISNHDIPDDTRIVNFHGNEIRRIDGLSSQALGQNLRVLDLSFNQIRLIENLDALVHLQYLNLAANLITDVGPGLQRLVSLESLDLSFNQIQSLDGLQCFGRGRGKLKSLRLHGNQLEKLSSILPIVQTLTTLTVLTFEIDEATNPFCRDPNYLSQLWAHCPQLISLDGENATGGAVEAPLPILAEAELAGLLGFLSSNDEEEISEVLDESTTSDHTQALNDETISSSSDSQLNLIRATYPRIEAALRQFKRSPADAQASAGGGLVVDNGAGPSNPTLYSLPVDNTPSNVDETRLANIERQLKELLQGRSATTVPPTITNQQDVTTVTSNMDEGTQTDVVEGPQTEAKKSVRIVDPKEKNVQPEKPDVDSQKNDDGYLRNLLGQLDEERERRWSTQKKCDDLSTELRDVTEKREQEKRQIEEALTLVRRLQARLDSGKASQRELERNLDSLTDANEKLERDFKTSEQRETALQRLLRELQEKGNRMNKEKDEKVKALENELEAVTKESDLAASEAAKYKAEVEKLMALLAEKEKDHQESLKGKYSIGSAEIQTLLTKEGDRISETYKMQVDAWRRKYQELEDEFRLALHLEADRFSTLQSAEEKVQKENVKLNASLSDLVSREARASSLVKELSELAKEQKIKMAEMSRTHQSSMASLKKRCDAAEAALSTARERLKALDQVTLAKSQLETKYAALESLAKNIKAEKELWSSELAQQGAALSQDRGRLEAKVEALTAEIASLKKQLERDADSLRIKSKVIEDQTESIKKLKDGLLERDRRIKEANDEHVAKEKESETRLEEEIQIRAAADERVEYLERRKEELKAEMAGLEEESATMKETNEKLVHKWKERSKLIESLEVKVAEMKKSWDEKEETLTRERDAAMMERDETRSKSAAIDAAFRSQLDQTRAAHARALADLEALKNLEVEEAHAKVAAAEDEMREILRESAEQKALMQKKIKNLTSAFAELQS